MPFTGYDPRELGRFDGVEVPEHVIVPTTSGMSWCHFPDHNWVFNKLEIAVTQGIPCSPLGGRAPDRYPVFIKPVYNFFGMGSGTCVARDAAAFDACKTPGCFWVEFLEGEHLSHDIIMVDGVPRFQLAFKGHPLSGQRFDYWETVQPPGIVTDYLYEWIERYMSGYTGCLNLETIGGRIIEAHLRMGDIKRIPDPDLLQSIVNVYAGDGWHYDKPPPKYFLVVLWGDGEKDYVIDEHALAAVRAAMDLVDIYDPKWRHENPPGALRVAQLGTRDLQRGLAARDTLAAAFTPPVYSTEAPHFAVGG